MINRTSFSSGIRSDGTKVSFWTRWMSKGTGLIYPADEAIYRNYAEMQRGLAVRGCLPPYEISGIYRGSEEESRRMRAVRYDRDLAAGNQNRYERDSGLCKPDRPIHWQDKWWAEWLDGGRPTTKYSYTNSHFPAGLVVTLMAVVVAAVSIALIFGS